MADRAREAANVTTREMGTLSNSSAESQQMRRGMELIRKIDDKTLQALGMSNSGGKMKRVIPVVSLLAFSVTVSALSIHPAVGADLSKFMPSSGAGIVNIDQREAQIERRIKDAVGAGRLTRAESQTFLDDLDKISDNEASFRASSDSLSTWETLKLVFQLDTLSRRLEQSLRDRTISSADLTPRISEIESRLSDAQSSKRLTDQEATEFSYELNRVKLQKDSYNADGIISDTEALKLSLALDTLSSRMESTMHDRQYQMPNIDKLQAELNKRIGEGISSGKIDAKESDELKQEFQRIATKEAKLKRFGRPLTSVETLELALDLESLSQKIDKFSTTTTAASPDFVKRKAHVEARAARGVVSGKLTLAEAYQVKEQLAQLDVDEKEWSKSDGNLSASEQKSLALNLEKIATGLERRLADTSKSWPGINEKLEIFNTRITAARSKGRLTEQEAASLNEDWKRIASKWNNYLTDEDGVYPLEPTLAVAASLEQLGQKLSVSLHDRSVEIPQLEALRSRVDDRISAGLLNAKLTIADGRKYIDELTNVTAKMKDSQSSSTGINDRDRLLIAVEFQQLLAKVERSIKDTVPGINSTDLKEQLEDQINEGAASGKLTDEETKYLKKSLAEAKKLESKPSGVRLNAQEALTFLQWLRDLQTSVKRELQDSEIATTDLGRRMNELQVRIATGVTTGKLTPAEATDLRKELTRIKGIERDYNADGGVSRGESVTLSYLLETLGARVEASMSDSHVSLPNISRMQEDIDRKLANAVVGGTINLTEVDQFTAKLEDISRLELSFRYSGDGLSFAESATLKGELDKLNATIDASLSGGKHRWTGLDEGIQKTSQRIDEGAASKKIPPDAAATLRTELGRIQRAKVAFAHSQGGYDLEETESLVKDLDRLNAEVDLRLKGQSFAWGDIERRQQNVEQLIRNAIKSGKLNSEEAKDVQIELDRIKRAKAAFTMSDGDLNYFERVSLAGALDKLDDMMRRKTR